MTPAQKRLRLDELLAIKATQRSTPAETNELNALLAAFPDLDPESLELAAAAVHLALSFPLEAMPTALAEKLYVASVALTPTAPAPAPSRAPTKPVERAERRGRPAWAMWGGWVVAAGLAGVLVYMNWPKPPDGTVRIPTPQPPPTLEERANALLKDPGSKAAPFADTKGNASARVVWSDVKQEGYLQVRGLPPNDPTKERYQLWIVDDKRKGEKPISGGLFDVDKNGTTWVPVNASLPIGDAAVFAITKEIPGGVVESKGPMLLVMSAKPG